MKNDLAAKWWAKESQNPSKFSVQCSEEPSSLGTGHMCDPHAKWYLSQVWLNMCLLGQTAWSYQRGELEELEPIEIFLKDLTGLEELGLLRNLIYSPEGWVCNHLCSDCYPQVCEIGVGITKKLTFLMGLTLHSLCSWIGNAPQKCFVAAFYIILFYLDFPLLWRKQIAILWVLCLW
jgi:hypothetical protein